MKKRVLLTRDNHCGYYHITTKKPVLCTDKTVNLIETPEEDIVITSLCDKMVKQWFGLKRNIRRGTSIWGTLEVKFKPEEHK